MDQELKECALLSKLISKYDKNKTGKLERDQVRVLLTDLDTSTPADTQPSEEELEYIMQHADTKCSNGAIDHSELKSAIQAWRVYIKERPAMEEAMKKYDVSKSGKLERDELKKYLTDLNGGNEVTDDEVDWVLQEADVCEDGAISTTELMKATAAWYACVEAKKNQCCILL